MISITSRIHTDEDFTRTVVFLIAWLIVGLIGIIFQSPLAWSTAFLMAIASIACGATVGFLFGIPRTYSTHTDTPIDAANPPSTSPSTTTKTNLEEIADWLTKILLGAGLTQIGRVPSALESMAHQISGPANSNIVPITISIWLYFSILGFFLGYLVTRLFLTRALAWADSIANSKVVVAGETYKLEDMLTDLRKGIADLQDHAVKQSATTLTLDGQPEDTTTEQAQKPHGLPVRSLLWIDEKPPSDSLLVEKLQSLNITVNRINPQENLPDQPNYDRIVFVAADSSNQALADQILNRFISDIEERFDARNVVIYCSPEKKARLEGLLDHTHIGGITSSAVDLLTLLRLSE